MTAALARRLVMDSSAVVALLTDAGPAGEWMAERAAGAALAAPALMPYEVGSVLRRHVLAGVLDASAAALAHADLTALPVDLCPYRPLAGRAWELHRNLTIYDAACVALAELLGVELLTLDARLARAPGPRCPIVAYRAPVPGPTHSR